METNVVAMGQKIKGSINTVYTIVAVGEIIYLAVNIAPQSVNFHVYCQDNLSYSNKDKAILLKIGFTDKGKYWSLRLFKSDHVYAKEVLIGGIIFALASINPWTSAYPKL